MDLGSHQRMLTAIAARIVGAADAEDVVQETFLRALAHPPADVGASMAPWLATVARNLAVDLLRHRGRLVDLDGYAEPPVDAGSLPPAQGLPGVLAGLGGLTAGEVTVLLLRDALDLDVEEVSAALDISPGSVRVLHHRARKKAAVAAPLEQGLVALDRFLTWLLARSVAGLPVVGGGTGDPGLGFGVLSAHLTLLDAVVELARSEGETLVEGRARLSRGTVRLALGRVDAAEDLQQAILLGADRTLAEARLGPLLYSRGEPDAALKVVYAALARGDRPGFHGVLHRVAAQVHLARADSAAAEPHLDALRALADADLRDQGEACEQAVHRRHDLADLRRRRPGDRSRGARLDHRHDPLDAARGGGADQPRVPAAWIARPVRLRAVYAGGNGGHVPRGGGPCGAGRGAGLRGRSDRGGIERKSLGARQRLYTRRGADARRGGPRRRLWGHPDPRWRAACDDDPRPAQRPVPAGGSPLRPD